MKNEINKTTKLETESGTITFRALDGEAAAAMGIDCGATLTRKGGGGIADAERVNGVWVAGTAINAKERRDLGHNSQELAAILNAMESE